MIADRLDKRRLIMATQAAAGTLALTLGVLTVTDTVELWMVYLFAAGFGAVTAIDNPARQTFVMEMVGPADVANAVTLNSVVINAARAVGPAIGGVLIATVGIGQCFIVNAASYLAVILALVLIRKEQLHPSVRSPRGPGQVREGFRYAWSNPTLRTTLIMLAVIGTLTYEFTTTLPLLSEYTFDAGASGLATMTALMGIGAVVGGLVVASAGNPTPARLVTIAIALGVTVSAVAFTPTIELAYLVMPLVGAASVAVIALFNATLQLNSAPELRGRVMALFSMSLVGSTPIGGPIVGYLGEQVSPRFALLVGGVAALAAGWYGWANLQSRQPAAAVAEQSLTTA
jgi:predicted MFS family arabinose efflux permease